MSSLLISRDKTLQVLKISCPIFIPLAIGYFAVNGLNPAGLLVMMGLANIVTGVIYRLPMPIEPKKVLAIVAITQKWPPSLIYATGFGTGVIWLILGFTGLIQKIAALTPRSVVHGIQVALGVMLAVEGFKMVATGWILGIISIVIVILLRENKYAPAAIVLMLIGIGVVGFRGELAEATVIATNALISQYFPNRPVTEKKLAVNMGIMNVAVPFFGGMPMCHGAGGLAGQYYFGAMTGGTNIIEGLIEISLGFFLAGSIATLFALFPQNIIGAMLLLVGIQLTGFARDIRRNELIIMALTAGVSLATNMAIGFVLAVIVYHALRKWKVVAKYVA